VQVASRRVVVISAIVMIAASLFGKWMAVLIMIPEPVIGGLFIVLCGELSVTVSVHVSMPIALLDPVFFIVLRYLEDEQFY